MDRVLVEVVDDIAVFVGAVLPFTIDCVGHVRAHRCDADDRADVGAPWARLGIGIVRAATATHQESSSPRYAQVGDMSVPCGSDSGERLSRL